MHVTLWPDFMQGVCGRPAMGLDGPALVQKSRASAVKPWHEICNWNHN